MGLEGAMPPKFFKYQEKGVSVITATKCRSPKTIITRIDKTWVRKCQPQKIYKRSSITFHTFTPSLPVKNVILVTLLLHDLFIIADNQFDL